MKKYAKIAGKVFVSGVLIYFLIQNVNWMEVLQYFLIADPLFVSLAVVFYICGLIISAYKWRILAMHLSFARSFSFYMHTYVFGTLLNNFFPSFVGGDTYRTFALGKENGRLKDASATVVVDRISGLFGTIILAIFCGMFNLQYIIHNTIFGWMMMTLVIILIFCCTGMIFFRTEVIHRFVNLLPQTFRVYVNTLERFRGRHIGGRALVYTIFFTIVGVACTNYVLFFAMDIHISFVNYVSVIFLTSIIAAVPVSVGNIGTKEWAYVFLFGLFGVSSSAAVAVVILSRVLQMIVSFGSLPGYFCGKK